MNSENKHDNATVQCLTCQSQCARLNLFKVHIIQKDDGLFPVFQSSHGSTVGKSIAQAQCDHLGKHLPCHPKRWPSWNNIASWHLEGCLPLVAPLTCGNDRTSEDHISKCQCICLSLLVIVRHHLSISFLLIAAPIDNVHDFWFRSNAHTHTHIHTYIAQFQAKHLYFDCQPGHWK